MNLQNVFRFFLVIFTIYVTFSNGFPLNEEVADVTTSTPAVTPVPLDPLRWLISKSGSLISRMIHWYDASVFVFKVPFIILKYSCFILQYDYGASKQILVFLKSTTAMKRQLWTDKSGIKRLNSRTICSTKRDQLSRISFSCTNFPVFAGCQRILSWVNWK